MLLFLFWDRGLLQSALASNLLYSWGWLWPSNTPASCAYFPPDGTISIGHIPSWCSSEKLNLRPYVCKASTLPVDCIWSPKTVLECFIIVLRCCGLKTGTQNSVCILEVNLHLRLNSANLCLTDSEDQGPRSLFPSLPNKYPPILQGCNTSFAWTLAWPLNLTALPVYAVRLGPNFSHHSVFSRMRTDCEWFCKPGWGVWVCPGVKEKCQG